MSDFEFEVIMSEDYSDEADLEWVPPTEAEQKVIAARRERSDKISKLMGEYMLKGYKMLATTCPKCGTIELEDKQSRIYCVACEEVDSEENSKDNPAVNQRAARNQIAEGSRFINFVILTKLLNKLLSNIVIDKLNDISTYNAYNWG